MISDQPTPEPTRRAGDPAPAGYACWGDQIEEAAHQQMRNARSLPVSVAAALMPDAHVGYGLPIGGVLATDNAVIPYAVGVDIACRVRLTVFDLPAETVDRFQDRLAEFLERETRFGVGAAWKGSRRAEHPVMDADWRITPATADLKDTAWEQLGTSGSGNHFVEFGELEAWPNHHGIPAGRHLAVLSHSGSRGAGARVASHYSKLARDQHPELPKELSHLAWLDMRTDGQEYWAAMELMGRYAAANHAVIHDRLADAVGSLGGGVACAVENHHNFAWKETHEIDGRRREVIVHRKGATPAGKGQLGFVPGSMAAPGYVVEGLGDPRSLDSGSHGAGRVMSRTQAKKVLDPEEVRAYLRERRVRLLSAGLDESPQVYKNIDRVLDAQSSLMRRVARFTPRIVKMAPSGERPED
ncbi:MAG TPA: RtcB family protein [Phycisphaerales bacterium]|nr:RtcB family protein [Phycisphaerales bacterium]